MPKSKQMGTRLQRQTGQELSTTVTPTNAGTQTLPIETATKIS